MQRCTPNEDCFPFFLYYEKSVAKSGSILAAFPPRHPLRWLVRQVLLTLLSTTTCVLKGTKKSQPLLFFLQTIPPVFLKQIVGVSFSVKCNLPSLPCSLAHSIRTVIPIPLRPCTISHRRNTPCYITDHTIGRATSHALRR